MSNTTIAQTLANLSKKELLGVLTTLLEDEVTQAPTEVAEEEKPKCSAIASSTGERCTRNATQGDTCKSHVGWDNEEALEKHAKAQAFVESRREAAQKKGKTPKGPKVDNKVLAAQMREAGLTPNGDDWARVKALIAKDVPMEMAVRTRVSEKAAA